MLILFCFVLFIHQTFTFEELNRTRAPVGLALLTTIQKLNLLSSLVPLEKPVFYTEMYRLSSLLGSLVNAGEGSTELKFAENESLSNRSLMAHTHVHTVHVCYKLF